jgi:cytoskeletal protein RodZ
MAQFGSAIRLERERRGISLDTIAEVTKVSVRYLTSLEEEHFDYLPGGVLNKGIVRSYASAVGLDQDFWISRFMEAYRESGQMKDDDIHWVEFAENVSRSRVRKPQNSSFRLRWAGVFMLLSVLAVSGWFVYNYVNSKVDAATPATQTTSPNSAQLATPATSGS